MAYERGIGTSTTTTPSDIARVLEIYEEIKDVAAIDDEVVVVAANDANITTVATDLSGADNIGTVAGDITNVNNVGANIAAVIAVDANETNINTVATDLNGADNIGIVAGSITNVNNVGGNITNVLAVDANETNINTVAADLAGADNIGTVAGSIADVNATGQNIADVTTVATDLNGTDTIGTVAADLSGADNIGTVAGSITDVNALGPIAADISAVAAIDTNVTAVAGNATNINTVAGNTTNINTVAGNDANITTVAGISGNVTTVAGISGNVTTVAGISGNVTTVAGISANVTSVAGNATNINTVAGNTTNINTVATNNTNVTTVATNIADVNTVAAALATPLSAANAVSYDNSVSGLTATDVQDAIDEVEDRVDDAEDELIRIDTLADSRLREAFRKEKSTTIAPSLLLDFEGDKALDPRITFTRTTTARYYDGKTVAKAEENLLLRSQDYSATWTATNLTPVTGKTAPDGTSTATEFTASAANAVLTQGFTAIAGSYTFSVFLRRVTGTGDIQIAADNGTWNTKVITASWARYDITQTATAGAKTAGIRVVDSGDAIEVWGAQLEQRSSVTAYTPTTTQPITNYIPVIQTAAAGQARFDHNPVTGESLGLLIEEQRTNLLTYSAQFDDAVWGKSEVTITANTLVAPDGTLTADQVTTTGTSTAWIVSPLVTAVAGSDYTSSFMLKKGSATWVRIVGFNGNAGGFSNILYTAWFDLDNGTLGATSNGASGTVTNSTIQNLGNGWYRCSVTGKSTSSTNLYAYVVPTTGDNTTTRPSSGSTYFIWGAQLEAGDFPTSYIPTVAATVTRNADAAIMTGTNVTSWFSNAEGTLYTEVNPRALAVTSGIQLNDNTTSNRIRLATTSVSDQGTVTTNGTAQATLDGGTPDANTNMKLAMSYKVNDFKLSLDGATAATDTAGTVPVVNQLQLGAETTTIGNMTLKKVAYYPIALSAAQLESITT